MFAPRSFLAAALLSVLLPPTASAPAEVFTGYLGSPPGVAPLVVDGRTVLLSPQTRYSCSASTPVTTEHDIPVFPLGLQVSVQGSWDKRAQAWRAEQVCPGDLPAKTAAGHGVVDAVVPSGTDLRIDADGRHFLLAKKG